MRSHRRDFSILPMLFYEFHGCLYGPFVHLVNILSAVCCEQRDCATGKNELCILRRNCSAGKRDTISDRAIIPPIVRSCLCDDRFALFLSRSNIMQSFRLVIMLAYASNMLRSYEFSWGFSYARERKQTAAALFRAHLLSAEFWLKKKKLYKTLNQAEKVVILNIEWLFRFINWISIK